MAIEAIHCIERSIETMQNTHFENETIPIFNVKEGVGFSSVESAKGTIYHYYEIDKTGRITKARIISPIEQNERFLQKAISNMPFDPDKKTRKQVLDEIDFLIDVFYL
jgi:coenzyme F420-reducing hydrogenase alpha subunit